MSSIVKIVIKGSSGFGPGDLAYEDKLTLTASSIAYEYKPLFASEENPTRKWSYKTTAADFAMLFSRVSELIPSVLNPEFECLACDAGMIDFTVTYEDRRKMNRTHWGFCDDFKEIFSLIQILVPRIESIPEVIRTYDDNED